VLVAWGVTLEGRKVLLGLALGSRESYENWLAFGRDLADRGLRAPALIIADAPPGSGRPRASCGRPPRSSAAASTSFGT
jgi:transposase-like protein